MEINMEKYKSLMEFLAEMLGMESELVLYNIKQSNVYYVINAFDDEMCIGSSIRSLERSFIEHRIYEEQNYIVNYRALTKYNKKLKSATYFFKADNGQLDAILTINIDMDKFVEFRDLLNILISGKKKKDVTETTFYNSFDVSIEGFVSQSIADELHKYHVEPTRLSPMEKIEIVKKLDEKGIFLVKGSISELAEALNTTETTIYRYLNK